MKRKKIFYGWFVVAGCMILRLGLGIPNYSLGVFLKPMCEDLGISRGAFSAYSTFSHLMTMLMLPLMGEWFKKYHFKRLLWLGAIMTTLAIFCYSFVHEVWQFYLFSAVNGMFSGMLNSVPIAMLMANWFKKKRALATSIAFAGSGISAMLVVPLANAIIERAGWSTAFRVIAGIYLVFTFVPLIFIIKVHPSEVGEVAYGEETVDPVNGEAAVAAEWGLTRNQAIHTRTFWMIGLCMLMTGFVFMGTQSHVIAYLSDIGFSSQFASLDYSIIMLFDTVGKIMLGVIYEKIGFKKTNVSIFTLFFAAECLLLFTGTKAMAVVYAVMMGLCAGIQTGLYPTVINHLLGDKEYGLIYSNLNVMYFIGMALGVPASGFVFDAFGSYKPAWAAYSVVIVIILCLLCLADKMSKKEVTDRTL